MLSVSITSLSVSPKLQNVDVLAKTYGISYAYLTSFIALTNLLQKAAKSQSSMLLEINEALIMGQIV